jgi:hypothetical protein
MNKSKFSLYILLAVLSFSLLTITVMADSVGNGTLTAYSDSGYTSILPNDSSAGGTAMSVYDGQTIYLQISGITEFTSGTQIYVRVKWGADGGHIATLGPFTVHTLTSGNGTDKLGVGDDSEPIAWTVGVFDDATVEIPYCNTMPVDYGTTFTGKNKDNVMAKNAFGTTPPQGHLHVIPELPIIGTAGASIAMFAGLAIKMKRKPQK